MTIRFDMVAEIDQKTKGKLQSLQEKVYAFADYLPPGNHNTCLLYNTLLAPLKSVYNFLTPVKARKQPPVLRKALQINIGRS